MTTPKKGKKKARVLPEGLDLKELQRDTSLQPLVFEHKGKAWEFMYTSVSWDEHWQAVERSWLPVVGDDGEQTVEFDLKGYYYNLLPKHIVSIPGGGACTIEFLESLDSAVVAKLATVVPSPLLEREMELVKKELKPTLSSVAKEDVTV